MNIFDELAESYTYNGVVSLKALEDDIVTLENQIDNFAATLKELQLRGKKAGPLTAKMRDAKIRLSLLKAVYKRESDRSTSDDIILNMLGISANNAKEVETPETAADGKEPHVQDFEESEIEVVEESVEDAEIVESEEDPTDEVITEEIEEEEEPADALVPEEETDAPIEEIPIEKTEEDDKVTEICFPDHKIYVNEDTGQVVLNDTAMTNPTEYYIPPKEEENEADSITYPGEPMDNFVETIPEYKVNEILNNEDKNEDHECPPPPTLDDYYEAMAISDGSYVADEYDEAIYCGQNNDVDASVVEAPEEPQINENIIEDGMPEPPMDFDVYEPFYKPVDEIYSSFDLSPYTDMVNTDTVTGAFDNKKKTLEITFFDTRDYSVFVQLLKEKKPGLFSFLEKPKSIFMDVHERHGDNEKIYHYEFVGCKLKKLFDSRYSPKKDTAYSETVTHECTAVFKYKKLKLS